MDLLTLVNLEYQRQQQHIELIASENIVSKKVLSLMGSILTNKYAEGYPGKRYYGGCEFVDQIENLAINKCKQLFKCQWANVQPHSGSQANQAVFSALLQPGDKILGLSLDAGGHLTHGAKVNFSGKVYQSFFYGVEADGSFDFDKILTLAKEIQPKLIICGGSAIPKTINFEKFSEIAKTVNAYLLADIAHIAGLVASDLHPSPVPFADVVTSTTHKTLRGPRGGIIFSNNEELGKKIDKAIFPGIQGGPLLNIIAAKAQAFDEALTDDFKIYSLQVIKNCKTLYQSLQDYNFGIVANGSDNHLFLMDLSKFKNEFNESLNGLEAQILLENSFITTNKNAIPNDPQPPTKTSGLRIGTPAITTRGAKESDMILIAQYIFESLYYKKNSVRNKVLDLTETLGKIPQ
jgi:glycine hydroxymethyltransferase